MSSTVVMGNDVSIGLLLLRNVIKSWKNHLQQNNSKIKLTVKLKSLDTCDAEEASDLVIIIDYSIWLP